MGGVDKHDLFLTYYNLAGKAMKWYKKYMYFFDLFDICVFNAACLYTKDPVNKSVTNLKYREILIEEILDLVGPHPATFTYRQPPVRISLGETSSRLTERHFPSFMPLTEHAKQKGDREKYFKDCVLCPRPLYADKQHSHSCTEYECTKCGNVPLCPAPCFKKYHTVSKL